LGKKVFYIASNGLFLSEIFIDADLHPFKKISLK